MSRSDYKVSAFRSKYECDLRRLVTRGCCVASVAYDGNLEVEEAEMNEFAKDVLALVEKAKRRQRRSEDTESENVTPIRA